MITHRYRTVDVPVEAGTPHGGAEGARGELRDGVDSTHSELRVGVWDPIQVPEGAEVPSALFVHGITSSHQAWPLVVAQLPGTRIIAPDLRGRGASRNIAGPAGMAAHASDLVAVLDALGVASLPVVGHSMGGFVAVVLAHLAPERVERLELLDGGLPLDVPRGLTPEQVVAAVLGPTAERLAMRFETVEQYLDFWRAHPAFAEPSAPALALEDEVEACFAHDLVPEGRLLRPSTSLRTTTEDTADLNAAGPESAIVAALTELASGSLPVRFVTVPRGLQGEAPGLYPPAHLERILPGFPGVEHVRLDDGLNHYTLVMSARGATALGELLRPMLG